MNPGHVQKKGIIAAGMGQKIGEVVPVLREIRRRAFRRFSPGERIPLELIQNLLEILRIAPGDEIVLVAELAVKSRLGIASVFDDLLHGDPVNRFLHCQLPERIRENFLCRLRFHACSPGEMKNRKASPVFLYDLIQFFFN